MHLRPLLILTCLPLLVSSGGCQTDPYRASLDEMVQPYLDGEYIVGMSIGILTPEGRYTYHYGQTRRGESPPTDRTLYEIGSITKTMTGLLLADGVNRGLYELDTPAQTLLRQPVSIDEGITLRRLSIHTSGLPRMPTNFRPTDPADPYASYTEEQLLAYLQDPQMQSRPGSKASYSNLGVGLLGYVLGEREGKTYEALLTERVLIPLGMRDTRVTLRDDDLAYMAGPHNPDAEPAHPWTIYTLAGAGGVRSNIRDMLAYADAQVDPGSTPLADAIRLSQMVQNQEDGASVGDPMGLGWFMVDGGDTLVHGGQTGGFKTTIVIAPQRKQAVILLTNTTSTSVSRLGQDITRLVAGVTFEPYAPPTPIDLAPQVIKQYTGHYVGLPPGRFVVEQLDGRLYAKLNNQPTLRLYPQGDDTFLYRAVEARIVFERDDAGAVSKLVLYQNGNAFHCGRVPQQGDQPEP
ncbi:MAG: serine hydrolase domain-containing protein [Planctomycetota bacterium]